MKKIHAFALLGILVPLFSFLSPTNLPSPEEDMATVYIYRGGQAFSAGLNYVIEANGAKICRLSNNKYIEHKVAPGTILYTAKRGGVELLKRETELNIQAEAGKKYYIKCDVKSSITRTRLEMSEVMPSTGERDLAKMKPDACNESDDQPKK